MVAPLVMAALSPLVKGLLANGLSLLGNAIVAKGKAAVEEKLGVKLPDEQAQLTPEQLEHLRSLQFDHEEALIELAIKKAQVELEADRIVLENVEGARKMNASIQESAEAAKIAKVAPYVLDFIIISVTLLLAGIIMFHAIPTENREIIYTVFGSLLTMCMTILNFHRGTSAASKNKDDTILEAMKKGN